MVSQASGLAEPRDVEEPLLSNRTDEGDSDISEAQPHIGTCTVFGGVSNLTVTAVGAGMLALPKAFATVGITTGLGLFVFVCLLTYFSTSIVVRYGSEYKTRSYSDLIKAEFGDSGAFVLQSAIIIHVGGVMIVYLIIIADMLVGAAPDYAGVLPTMLGRHDNPWFLHRAFVVAVLLCAVVLPMLIPRSLTAVSRFSRMGIAMVLVLATTICSLAVLAVSQGMAAPDVHVLPRVWEMGDGTPLGVTTALLTVVSVAAMAFTCHFNLIPIQQSLRDPRCSTMLTIIRRTLAICASFYTTVAISGYVLFGSRTDGDVLKNLTIHFVQGLVPSALAHVLIDSVALCYTFNLLVNFVLKVWAVRENVSEMVYKRHALQLRPFVYYQTTAVLVAVAYGLSVVVPSVWALVSLVGSTACVTFSYIFPGLLVLRKEACIWRRVFALGMLVLGSCMAAVAIFNQLSGKPGV